MKKHHEKKYEFEKLHLVYVIELVAAKIFFRPSLCGSDLSQGTWYQNVMRNITLPLFHSINLWQDLC